MLKNSVCAVIAELGFGQADIIYHRALDMELSSRGCIVEYRKIFQISYKGIVVGAMVPDLIVRYRQDEFVLDLRTDEAAARTDQAHLRKCLELAKCKMGYLLYLDHDKGLVACDSVEA